MDNKFDIVVLSKGLPDGSTIVSDLIKGEISLSTADEFVMANVNEIMATYRFTNWFECVLYPWTGSTDYDDRTMHKHYDLNVVLGNLNNVRELYG